MESAVLAALCGATLLSVIHFAQRFQKRRLRKGDKAQVATSPKDGDKAFRLVARIINQLDMLDVYSCDVLVSSVCANSCECLSQESHAPGQGRGHL